VFPDDQFKEGPTGILASGSTGGIFVCLSYHTLCAVMDVNAPCPTEMETMAMVEGGMLTDNAALD